MKKEIENNYLISHRTILIRSMCVTGLLLGLSIITNMTTDLIKLTFLGSFLSLDLSLIFIIPIVFICKFRWGFFAAFLLGCFSFIHSGFSSWVGPLFNIMINIFVVSIIYIFYFVLFKNIKINKKIKLIFSLILSFIFIILFSCLINGLIFTPLYVSLYSQNNIYASFLELQKIENYPIYAPYVLGIKNYWLGIFAIYSSFNAIKFSIVLLFTYISVSWLLKNKIVDKYFYKTDK